MTAPVAAERESVTTGSTWSPTRTFPRGKDQAAGGCDRHRLLLVGDRHPLVVRAVQHLERPEADDHRREGDEHDEAHDRKTQPETGALLAALLLTLLVLDALERARADDPAMSRGLLIGGKVRCLHRLSRPDGVANTARAARTWILRAAGSLVLRWNTHLALPLANAPAS